MLVAQTHILPCDKPTAERRICDDCNAELARDLKEPNLLVLDIEREGRVLDLQRRDRVHGMCAPKCVCRALREAEVLYLAGPVMVVFRWNGQPQKVNTNLTSSAIAPTVFSIGTVGSGLV